MAEYIEREALLGKFNDVISGKTYCTVESAVRRINDAPAADVAPVVHGRWEHHENGVAYCSECEMDAVEDGTDYCPNCGAKMDAEVSDNA